MSCERAYWLAWREINGVGPTLQKRIASHFELLENAWKATPVALAEVSGLGEKVLPKFVTNGFPSILTACWQNINNRIPSFGLLPTRTIPAYFGKFPRHLQRFITGVKKI